MFWKSDKKELVTVIILHRHGARFPTKGALKKLTPLLSEAAKTESDLVDQWDAAAEGEQLEKLTDYGRQMSYNFGKWLATEYFGHRHPSFLVKNSDSSKTGEKLPAGEDDLFWGHSFSDRVQETGQRLWKGMKDGNAIEVEPSKNMTGETVEVLDPIYRPWYAQQYEEWAKQLRKGDLFLNYYKNNKEKIDKALTEIGIDLNAFKDDATKVDVMTSLWEMIENESATTSDKDFVSNSLSKEGMATVEETARWIWEKRYYDKGQRLFLGTNLLKVIMSLIRNEGGAKRKKFALLSAHDYTVMCLLNMLGESTLRQNVGFATYVIFEVYKKKGASDSDDNLRISIKFNATPFSDHHKPIEQLSEKSMREVEVPGSKKGFLKVSDLQNLFNK